MNKSIKKNIEDNKVIDIYNPYTDTEFYWYDFFSLLNDTIFNSSTDLKNYYGFNFLTLKDCYNYIN